LGGGGGETKFPEKESAGFSRSSDLVAYEVLMN